jgi:predicted Rossmann fold nucleotide-binding protein DprA/Smf involved in DNA uptake
VAARIDEIDEHIGTLAGALGSKGKTMRAAAGPRRARGRARGRGGIASAVTGALSGGKTLQVSAIVKATGLARGQVYACLQNLKKTGRVKSKGRGAYALAGRGATKRRPKKRMRRVRAKTGTRRQARPGRRRGAIREAVLKVLNKKTGLRRGDIMKATGLKAPQVAACLMSLKKAKLIKTKSRGLFCRA